MELNDYPKMYLADDDLGFKSVASAIVSTTRELDKSNGCVVGITGPWGSGKTSMLHFMEELLDEEKETVLWFNPWQFSKSDDLMQRLFETLRSALGRDPKFKAWAQKISKFADVIEPINHVPGVSGGARLVTGAMKTPKVIQDSSLGDVNHQRESLEVFLRQQERDIYVFVDDLDRLPASEVMEILKFVRLTASFPRFTYVLAFDERNVANLIQRTGEYQDGHEFLQKIIFASFRIPKSNDELGMGFLIDRINELVGDYPEAKVDQQRAYRVLRNLVLPLCENRRNVKRLMASARPVMYELSNDVDPIDVIAMESVRLFCPDAFEVILEEAGCLSWSMDDLYPFNEHLKKRSREAINRLIEATNRPSSSAVWSDLFSHSWSHHDSQYSVPVSLSEALNLGRVTNRHILERYLSRYEDNGIRAKRNSNELLIACEDLALAQEFVRRQLEDHLLEIVEILHSVPVTALAPSIETLSIALYSFPTTHLKRPHRFVDASLFRAVENLLARVIVQFDEPKRLSVLNAVFDQVASVAARRYIAEVAEHDDEHGREILQKDAQSALKNRYFDSLVSMNPADLASEPGLVYLAGMAIKWFPERQPEVAQTFATQSLWGPLVKSSVFTDSRRLGEVAVVDLAALDRVFVDRKQSVNVMLRAILDDQIDVDSRIAIGNTLKSLRDREKAECSVADVEHPSSE